VDPFGRRSCEQLISSASRRPGGDGRTIWFCNGPASNKVMTSALRYAARVQCAEIAAPPVREFGHARALPPFLGDRAKGLIGQKNEHGIYVKSDEIRLDRREFADRTASF